MSVSWDQARAVVGLLALLALAWALSEGRRRIPWRVLGWGLGIQWVLALLVLKVPAGQQAVQWASDAATAVVDCAQAGIDFVFGSALGGDYKPIGFVFAFRVLPGIIFISALFAVLYYLRIMQVIVGAIGWVMWRLMGTSGAESLNAAAGIALGQTESPLTIRPYLPTLTRSELFCVMVSGMATVAGAVMVAYFEFADPAQVLTAAVLSAPAGLVFAKVMIPETQTPATATDFEKVQVVEPDVNLIDAAARGTRDGLMLALNVGAMLIAFLGLIALVDLMLGSIDRLLGLKGVDLSLKSVLGWLFAPVAYLLGVPWSECAEVGSLLGTRTVTNELVAFVELGQIKDQLSPRSVGIAAFALCGFANLSSIGIQIGGIGTLIPERRAELARLGLKAMLAATLANFQAACIAGVLL